MELLPPEAEPSSSSKEVSKTSASSAPSDSDYSLDETFTYTQQRIGEALEIINSGFCNYGEDQTLSRTLVNTGAYKAKIDLGYCRKASGDYNHETLSQGLKDSIIKSTYNNNSLTVTTWEADNFGELFNRNSNDKKLKNASSERVIPIHPKLIDLGVLNFVKEQNNNNSQRLFTHLKLGSEGYIKNVSRFSNVKWLHAIGVKTSKKSFHSPRHTFANVLKQAGVSEHCLLYTSPSPRD